MTRNQIEYQKLLETGRANLAKEQEEKRSNLSNEALRSRELAEVGRHNLVTEQETNRSNVEKERETNRSNLARELEANRHNLVSEDVGYFSAAAGLQGALANAEAHRYSSEVSAAASRANTESTVAQRDRDTFMNTSLQREQNQKDRESRERIASEQNQSRERISQQQEQTKKQQMLLDLPVKVSSSISNLVKTIIPFTTLLPK